MNENEEQAQPSESRSRTLTEVSSALRFFALAILAFEAPLAATSFAVPEEQAIWVVLLMVASAVLTIIIVAVIVWWRPAHLLAERAEELIEKTDELARTVQDDGLIQDRVSDAVDGPEFLERLINERLGREFFYALADFIIQRIRNEDALPEGHDPENTNDDHDNRSR